MTVDRALGVREGNEVAFGERSVNTRPEDERRRADEVTRDRRSVVVAVGRSWYRNRVGSWLELRVDRPARTRTEIRQPADGLVDDDDVAAVRVVGRSRTDEVIEAIVATVGRRRIGNRGFACEQIARCIEVGRPIEANRRAVDTGRRAVGGVDGSAVVLVQPDAVPERVRTVDAEVLQKVRVVRAGVAVRVADVAGAEQLHGVRTDDEPGVDVARDRLAVVLIVDEAVTDEARLERPRGRIERGAAAASEASGRDDFHDVLVRGDTREQILAAADSRGRSEWQSGIGGVIAVGVEVQIDRDAVDTDFGAVENAVVVRVVPHEVTERDAIGEARIEVRYAVALGIGREIDDDIAVDADEQGIGVSQVAIAVDGRAIARVQRAGRRQREASQFRLLRATRDVRDPYDVLAADLECGDVVVFVRGNCTRCAARVEVVRAIGGRDDRAEFGDARRIVQLDRDAADTGFVGILNAVVVQIAEDAIADFHRWIGLDGDEVAEAVGLAERTDRAVRGRCPLVLVVDLIALLKQTIGRAEPPRSPRTDLPVAECVEVRVDDVREARDLNDTAEAGTAVAGDSEIVFAVEFTATRACRATGVGTRCGIPDNQARTVRFEQPTRSQISRRIDERTQKLTRCHAFGAARIERGIRSRIRQRPTTRLVAVPVANTQADVASRIERDSGEHRLRILRDEKLLASRSGEFIWLHAIIYWRPRKKTIGAAEARLAIVRQIEACPTAIGDDGRGRIGACTGIERVNVGAKIGTHTGRFRRVHEAYVHKAVMELDGVRTHVARGRTRWGRHDVGANVIRVG